MALLFEEKVKVNTDAFTDRVKEISRKQKINPNWLMAVMNSETGGSFSPRQKNLAGSGATGLIQFMPSTARDLGTTTAKLAQMSNVQQLTWVDKYIDMQKRNFKVDKIRDYDDLYLMVFYPAAMGKPKDWAFPDRIYPQNKGIDLDKDGKITIKNFKDWIRKKIPKGRRKEFVGRRPYTVYLTTGLIILVVIVIIYFWFFRNK